MQSLSWLSDDYNPPERTSRVLPPCPSWQDGSVDIFGPLPTGESITVVVDYFSRFAQGAIYKSTIQAKIIEAIFARFDVLFSLRRGNGPQLILEDLESFFSVCTIIEHRRAIPLWPQDNSEVEHQNLSLVEF